MTDQPPPFATLLGRARAGDADAVEVLLRSVETRLRACVAARLGPKLRERLRDSDILQNAYLELLRSLPTFAGKTEDDFASWVAGIVEHDIQRQHRWFTAAKRKAAERSSEANALARILLDPPPTPSAEAIRGEEHRLLEQALGNLSADHAAIIRLVLLEGRSHREAAQALDRSDTATRMLLTRARTALSLEIDRLRRESRDSRPA